MKKDYCTQNNHKCATCSLANYGRDCRNHKIIDGGINENYRRDENGKLYQAFDGQGNLISAQEIAPEQELDWSKIGKSATKTATRKHGVNGWCDKCHTYCYGDCESH